MTSGHKGDEPDYFMSDKWWADRYRDFIRGRFTSKETVKKRQSDLAAESKRRQEKISKTETETT